MADAGWMVHELPEPPFLCEKLYSPAAVPMCSPYFSVPKLEIWRCGVSSGITCTSATCFNEGRWSEKVSIFGYSVVNGIGLAEVKR